MPADLQKARELFLHAVGKLPTEQWDGYVGQACGGDAALEQQVGHLLQVHREAGSFLDRPAAAVGATGAFTPAPGEEAAAVPLRERPGTVIGPYKLLQQIGEGGMGTVFLAEQTHPVQRKVALKVIKAGMDSRQVIARFEAERQALAMMDHVNIARVLDAGATESGRPYFVMELVHGMPITKYCDDNRLTPRERLELFVPVCQAIQHAHQKGIIHRDVKPSNVMVTLYDGQPVPKVIDFGVAKATEQKLTERTLFTQYGAMVGTLEYMSPEQAEMSALGVDTRSDIYSLGVLLYELLTGNTPLTHKRMKEAAYAEILRMIKEEEPPRPSTRLTDSGEALASISAQRHMEPAKLTKLVRGELDWIVMKALEKDRTRRYETANGFAADVQRYLADEPVLACPPSAGYRLRKFARRNKAGLATATALGLAVLVAVGSLGWGVRDRAAHRASISGQVEHALAEVDERHRQGRLSEAIQAAHKAVGLAEAGGPADLRARAQVVLNELELVAELSEVRNQAPDQSGAVTDADYAGAFHRHGLDVEDLRPAEAADQLADRPTAVELAAALDHWAGVLRRHPALGADRWKHLVAVARAADPDPWRNRLRAAAGQKEARLPGELAAADETFGQPVTSLALLGRALAEGGDRVGAIAFLRRAQREHPGDFHLAGDLAALLVKLDPTARDDAVRFCTAAVAIRPDSPSARSRLAFALTRDGRPDDAIAECRTALALKPGFATAHINLGVALMHKKLYDAAIAEHREALRLQPDSGMAHTNLGQALRAKGLHDEAIAEYRAAIAAEPDNHLAHNNLGAILCDVRRDYDAAIERFREAIRLEPGFPHAYKNLGIALSKKGAHDQAIPEFEQAIRLKPDYAHAFNGLGAAYLSQNRFDEAAGAFRKAVLLELEPGFYCNLAAAVEGQGMPDQALVVLREAYRLDPRYPQARDRLPRALDRRAWELANGADPSGGDRKRAIELAAEAVRIAPDHAGYSYTLGVAHYRAGNWTAAIEAHRSTLRLRRPGSPETGFTELYLALAHWKRGDRAEARQWFDQADQWVEKNQPDNKGLHRFRSEVAGELGVKEQKD
jgi:eukaryotic-like serine/threonine-protein kinase